jgi:hypothetical protein
VNEISKEIAVSKISTPKSTAVKAMRKNIKDIRTDAKPELLFERKC